MVQRTERKCGLVLWIERILTAGASAWDRRGVDEEVVAKRRLSGRDVVEEFDEGDDEREWRRRKRRGGEFMVAGG
jgi:hypothetical protein